MDAVDPTSTGTVRCASVLKPIYAMLARPSISGPLWFGTAEAAVIDSDNEATDVLVDACGGLPSLAESLSQMSGREMDVPQTWGRFEVDQRLLVDVYRHALDRPHFESVLWMMRLVREPMRFGAPDGLAVKAGWDIDANSGAMVTNVVQVNREREVRAWCSGRVLDDAQVQRWQQSLARGGPSAVLPMHPRPHREWWY